jgi:hypothetical protein
MTIVTHSSSSVRALTVLWFSCWNNGRFYLWVIAIANLLYSIQQGAECFGRFHHRYVTLSIATSHPTGEDRVIVLDGFAHPVERGTDLLREHVIDAV